MSNNNTERSIKVSTGVYDRVKALADTGGISIKRVADELVKAGLIRLKGVEQVSERIAEDSNIQVVEDNGKVYYCETCGAPLVADEEEEECPNCGCKLEWDKAEKGGLGLVGWSLVGLAALLAVGYQKKEDDTLRS